VALLSYSEPYACRPCTERSSLAVNGQPDRLSSRQLVEQRLGVLQDRCVEAFGEPTIDGCEQITGFGLFSLIAPEASKTGDGAQFKWYLATNPPDLVITPARRR